MSQNYDKMVGLIPVPDCYTYMTALDGLRHYSQDPELSANLQRIAHALRRRVTTAIAKLPAELLEAAGTTLENPNAWLCKRLWVLNNKAPVECAGDELLPVLRQLAAIEHGVYL